jgi:glycopeptide antibiotics resistance protein
MSLEAYWRNLFYNIPDYLLLSLLVLFAIGTLSIFLWRGIIKGWVYTIRLLLLELLFFICCSTVFLRKIHKVHLYNFKPLWSYDAIIHGDSFLLIENTMNVAVFIPVGLLLGIGFPKWSWWKILRMGLLYSITIEALQLITKRGFSETDDVIHNCIGCFLGYTLYLGLKQIISFIYRKYIISGKYVI